MSFIESETNNQFINTNTTNTIPTNPAFPAINTVAGTGENITDKLDQVWTVVNTEINDFLQLPDWVVKTRLAITGDWLANEAQDFFSHVSPENINVEILPANNMPGIAGGYDQITGKIYLSEDLLRYSDPNKIAEVLIEEIGHKADDILNPGQDSPGDEGEILSKLVINQGSIPSDWQVLKQEKDHKFIQVGNSWIGVEAASNVTWNSDTVVLGSDTAKIAEKVLIEDIGQKANDIFTNPLAVEVDGQGNIYLAGSTKKNLAGVNAGGSDTWLAKYSSEGQQLWIKQFGSKKDEYPLYMSVSNVGNVALEGSVWGNTGNWEVDYGYWTGVEYDSQGRAISPYSNDQVVPLPSEVEVPSEITWISDTVVVGSATEKIAEKILIEEIGKSSNDIFTNPLVVQVDKQGNIYLAGSTKNNLAGINAGGIDLWLAKYSSQGQQLWIQQYGSAKDEISQFMSIGEEGDVSIYYTNDLGYWTLPYDSQGREIGTSNNQVVPFNTGEIVLPNISIQDVNITEGNTGRKNAQFKVTLDQVTDKVITVQYTTVDDTAKSGQDFVKKTGELTFKPGVKTQTISVPIIGDTVFEPDEKFSIKLSEASNGKITKATAIGTITNDDQKVVVLPNISIQDVNITEGNSGQKNANFKVTLDKVSNQTVTVEYTTVNDTAKAGEDFVKKTGKVTFKPGVKTQTIAVPIIGDKLLETKEQFSVILSQASNAKITKANAIGSITNDDSGDVTPTIPLEDKEPDNNTISKKLPTFSNLREKPIEVLGKIGVLAGSQRDQNDYYRLILDQSENDLFVMLDGLQRDANIEILDRDGSTKLLSSTETDKTVDTISAILPAGTYYVRVYPKSSNATPYRLSVNV